MPTARNLQLESPVVVVDSESGQFFCAVSGHNVTKARYITSNDPRGYIPVYEYPLRGQWIMMDMEDGYILWTGIWKALGHSKADIVKFLDSEPDVAPRIRRIRGGYLKIQGTWMPYEVALRLSRRVAWDIRFDLVPLFGPTFPSTCMSPDQPGFGQITYPNGRRRKSACGPFVSNSSKPNAPTIGPSDPKRPTFAVRPIAGDEVKPPSRALESSHSVAEPRTSSPTRIRTRYVPYPDSSQRSHKPSRSSTPIHIRDISDSHDPSPQNPPWVRAMRQSWPDVRPSSVTLPPIMAFDNVHGKQFRDPPSVVLQRLKDDTFLPPHELYPQDDVDFKSASCLPLPHATRDRMASGNNISLPSTTYPLRTCRPISTSPTISHSSCTYQVPSPKIAQIGDDDYEYVDRRSPAFPQTQHRQQRSPTGSVTSNYVPGPIPSRAHTVAQERRTHYFESYDRR